MPEPKLWRSAEALREDLRNCDWKRWFEKERRKHKKSELKDIIFVSVGKSTFRRFRKNRSHRPSVVFREWAVRFLKDQSGLARFCQLRSQSAYDHWLFSVSGRFKSSWNKRLPRTMDHGASLKLLNLLFKQLLTSPEITSPVYKRLVFRLHVPLDKYTIQAFRKFSEFFPEDNPLGKIPASKGMGFIVDKQHYLAFQTAIRTLSGDKVPPIAFDILAWNKKHQK